jgi:hypothetical protein
LEGEDEEIGAREVRRRSQPPSRGWVERDGGKGVGGEGGMRRQRSFPNLYKNGRERRDSGSEVRGEDDMQGVKSGVLAVQEV